MTLPKGATKVARQFARAVIRRQWAELPPLFVATAQPSHTADSLEAAFSWRHLGPRLRQMHIDLTGEPEEIVPEIDPPKRFEVYEVEERDPPVGHDPAVPLGWVEVDFHPSEDSEFDDCYNCFLAFIDDHGPRIATYVIESATE